MKRIIQFLLALSTIFAITAQANDDPPQPKILRISGAVAAQTLADVSLSFIGFRNEDPFPAGLIVLVDSPGGDGEVAMAIGRLLRQHKAQVIVSNRCDSACVLLLMGGVVRAAGPGTLGVHAGRLTLMKSDGQIVGEVDASRSLSDSFQLAGYNRNIRLYLQEMGIGHGILDVMLAHKTNQVYKLTLEDMSRYRVIGFDNRYLNERVRALDAMGYSQQVNRIELFNRTMSIPKSCKASESSDRDFIDCYRRTLLAARRS